MLLGFQKRFEEWVRQGSKTHSIRALRKLAPRVGEVCHCYCGLRGKGPADLLGRWRCVRVDEIRIWEDRGDMHLVEGAPQGAGQKLRDWVVDRQPEPFPFSVCVEINGERLDASERNALAWRDGFRSNGLMHSFEEMVQFWRKEHGKGKRLNFHGQMVHWDFSQPVTDWKEKRGKKYAGKRRKGSVADGIAMREVSL